MLIRKLKTLKHNKCLLTLIQTIHDILLVCLKFIDFCSTNKIKMFSIIHCLSPLDLLQKLLRERNNTGIFSYPSYKCIA